jgi:hypothetical protein
MELGNPTASYCPTILIVDDDRACTNYWRKQFLNETSVGVVIANDLEHGSDLLKNHDLRLDGIVFDIYFETGHDSPQLQLYDGLDLAVCAEEERPRIPKYIMSYFAEDRSYVTKAQERGLAIEAWIQKEHHDPKSERPAPWKEVERGLMKHRLTQVQSEGDLDQRARDAQALTPLPIRTYLQDLGDDKYIVHSPLEVICVRDIEGDVRATAYCLGLLEDGWGDTVTDALDNLKEVILDHLESFDEQASETVVGYALKVKEQIDSRIGRRSVPTRSDII